MFTCIIISITTATNCIWVVTRWQ